MTESLFKLLETIDTPTVCNAIEVAQGKRGYHELAAALLNGKMSYPTVIFMNHKFEMLSPVPGYQEPPQFMKVANFFGSNAYKDTAWKDYSN